MMKRVSFIVLLVLASVKINAQDHSKWNLGLNLSTSFNTTLLIAPSLNLDVGKNFEIGIVPNYLMTRNNSSSGDWSYNQDTWGINLSGKYFLFRENKMDPYITFLVGLGKSYTESGFSSDLVKYQDTYLTFGPLLGNELQLGQSGWFFDFNVGLLWTTEQSDSSIQMYPFYSVGIKKRFLIK